MTSTDINIDNLIINKLTRSQWTSLCALGRIHENEIYDITDNDDYFYQKSQTSSSLDLSTEFAKYTIINKLTQAEYNELSVAGKIDDSQIYCITDADEEELSNMLSDYYTKSETNSLSSVFTSGLASIDSLSSYETKTDLSMNYYTRSQTSSSTQLKTELQKYVLSSSIVQTLTSGAKIATIAGKDLYAPEGGSGGTELAPCLVVLRVGSFSNSGTVGGITISGNGDWKSFTINGTNVQINANTYDWCETAFIVYVPTTDPNANKVKEFYCGNCLKYDTCITMSNGSVKQIKDIKIGDKVLSMNPITKELEEDEVIIAETSADRILGKYDIWTFSDGTKIETVNRHRFYNVQLNEFMYMEAWLNDEEALTERKLVVKLVNHETVNEKVHHCTLFTKKWNNYFANGLLSGNRNSIEIKL